MIALVAAGYGATGPQKMLPWALSGLLILTALGLVVRNQLLRRARDADDSVLARREQDGQAQGASGGSGLAGPGRPSGL